MCRQCMPWHSGSWELWTSPNPVPRRRAVLPAALVEPFLNNDPLRFQCPAPSMQRHGRRVRALRMRLHACRTRPGLNAHRAAAGRPGGAWWRVHPRRGPAGRVPWSGSQGGGEPALSPTASLPGAGRGASISRAASRPSSNSTQIDIASITCEGTSGGVKMAPMTNAPTIT